MFQLWLPDFSAAEVDLLKPRVNVSKISVDMEDVAHIQSITRQALMALNAVDLFFGALQNMSTSQDRQQCGERRHGPKDKQLNLQ